MGVVPPIRLMGIPTLNLFFDDFSIWIHSIGFPSIQEDSGYALDVRKSHNITHVLIGLHTISI